MEVNVELGTCPFEIKPFNRKKIEKAIEDPAVADAPEKGEIILGKLYFGPHASDVKHMPFMFVSSTVSMMSVRSKLMEWRAALPKIVLFVIADPIVSWSEDQRNLMRLLIEGLVEALNTTEMWLCTDGLHQGLSKDLGFAISNEMSRRKILSESTHDKNMPYYPNSATIGICSQDDLVFSNKLDLFQNSSNADEVTESREKYNVDKNFDYFIFVKNNTNQKEGVEDFVLNFTNYLKENLRIKRKAESEEESEEKLIDSSLPESETPVMALLFRGDVSDIHIVLGHLRNKVPVVIVEGSGGLADLLAFAIHEITFRSEGTKIAEFTEVVLKPQLFNLITAMYPNLSAFKGRNLCEKIFDCIRYSKQNERELVKLLTLRELKDESNNLASHLFRCLLSAQNTDKIKRRERTKKNIFLALDWNCPNAARDKIFGNDNTNKFLVDDETFFNALIKPEREKFVSLFLTQGFEVHKFLNSVVLEKLFQVSLHSSFFRNVVWENLLGYGSAAKISTHFIKTKLEGILEELTGIPRLIDASLLDWNKAGIYDNRTFQQAERKAIAVLSLWAILSYRVDLVKSIWKHCEQPVHLALVSSVILQKLQSHVTDLSLKNDMEKESNEFSIMATDIITKSYNAFPERALDLLCERNDVWSYKPLVEIAAFAKDDRFIASTCCQKYLDQVFMGKIKVRDLPYGDMTIPLWLKIVLTNFLIFPMFWWIEFQIPDESNKQNAYAAQQHDGMENTVRDECSYFQTRSKKLSFWRKLYLLYTAPISKFWVFLVFYLVYLSFFSLAVLWPACGSLYFDFVTCVWTGIIIMDSIYNVVILGKKFASMSLVFKSVEIAIMSVFLLFYILSRIASYRTVVSPYSSKVMLCLALLYFYYRLIFITFPISSELGPMLHRIKEMTLVDFMGFMRVTTLIIISNGIVIHATIWPDYPLGWELARRAFFDAIIAIFLTPAEYFGSPDMKCILLTRHPNKISFIGLNETLCKVGRYFDSSCPNPGFWPYIFGLQYFLLLKLILLTLLLALFSNTQTKMEALGTQIWKYQRYKLVIDFSNSVALPAPFSPFSYCFMLMKYLYRSLTRQDNSPEKNEIVLNVHHFIHWKSLASEYDIKTSEQKDEESNPKWRMKKIESLLTAMNKRGKAILKIQAQFSELQIQIKNAHKFLTSTALQISLKERLLGKNIPQIFSRVSPYPGTSIPRFPVPDYRVPWTCAWKNYDPIAYTMPQSDFPSNMRSHVDIDIQIKREIELEEFLMPVFKWNTSSVNPSGVCLNRNSWILDEFGKPFRYELDTEGLPMNPLGRTGLRGRGILPRWGPNHHMFVILTRWHETETPSHHNHLEVILMISGTDITLPGGFVSEENIYSIVWSHFKCDKRWNSETDMIEFFQTLGNQPEGKMKLEDETHTDHRRKKSLSLLENLRRSSILSLKRRTPKKSDDTIEKIAEIKQPLVFQRIRRGYLDEATNTDQAWCEAEIWHFHYNDPNPLEEKFKATMMWLVLTESVLEKIPPGQAALLYLVAKRMKAFLEVT